MKIKSKNNHYELLNPTKENYFFLQLAHLEFHFDDTFYNLPNTIQMLRILLYKPKIQSILCLTFIINTKVYLTFLLISFTRFNNKPIFFICCSTTTQNPMYNISYNLISTHTPYRNIIF